VLPYFALQIQMRDVGGFVDTRYRLLQLRSNNRNNWISFAIAHHLDGNHELCVQILSAYESTLVSSSCHFERKAGKSCSQY
jgi:peptide alpha-N-acetyltransferase